MTFTFLITFRIVTFCLLYNDVLPITAGVKMLMFPWSNMLITNRKKYSPESLHKLPPLVCYVGKQITFTFFYPHKEKTILVFA